MVCPVGAESLDKGICGPGSWEDLPLLVPMGSAELHGGSHLGAVLGSSRCLFHLGIMVLSFCGATKPDGGLGQT